MYYAAEARICIWTFNSIPHFEQKHNVLKSSDARHFNHQTNESKRSVAPDKVPTMWNPLLDQINYPTISIPSF